MKIKDFEYNFDNFGEFVKLNKDKLFRMWYNDNLESYCNYIYITGSIPIYNDILVLYQQFDETQEDNMYPSISFVKLSEITLAYYEDDQIQEDE